MTGTSNSPQKVKDSFCSRLQITVPRRLKVTPIGLSARPRVQNAYCGSQGAGLTQQRLQLVVVDVVHFSCHVHFCTDTKTVVRVFVPSSTVFIGMFVSIVSLPLPMYIKNFELAFINIIIALSTVSSTYRYTGN